jgi:hypothetical protein
VTPEAAMPKKAHQKKKLGRKRETGGNVPVDFEMMCDSGVGK